MIVTAVCWSDQKGLRAIHTPCFCCSLYSFLFNAAKTSMDQVQSNLKITEEKVNERTLSDNYVQAKQDFQAVQVSNFEFYWTRVEETSLLSLFFPLLFISPSFPPLPFSTILYHPLPSPSIPIYPSFLSLLPPRNNFYFVIEGETRSRDGNGQFCSLLEKCACNGSSENLHRWRRQTHSRSRK